MAQSAQLLNVGIKHEAILQFLVANPTTPMWMVAAHFQVSPSWLSVIIHSDSFQHKLAEYQEIIFDETVVPLRTRLQALAHLSLERLSDRIENSFDVKELRETAKMTLANLGYGATPGHVQVNAPGGSVTINQGMNTELQEARRLIGSVQPKITPHRLSETARALEDPAEGSDPSDREDSESDRPPGPALLSALS